MKKCRVCGKKGLFLTLSTDGLCPDCQQIRQREAETKRLDAVIADLEQKRASKEQSLRALESLLADRDRTYDELYSQAVANAEQTVIQQRAHVYEEVAAATAQLEGQLAKTQRQVEEAEEVKKSFISLVDRVNRLKPLYAVMQKSLKTYNQALDQGTIPGAELLNDDLVSQVEDLMTPVVEVRLQYMNMRDLRRKFSQNKSAIRTVCKNYEKRYTTKGNQALYRLMVLAMEAELQNILVNLKYGKLDKSLDLVHRMAGNYRSIASSGNQNIAGTMLRFISEIEDLYCNAVSIEYEYYVQRERAKEEQRALREQMRQEAKERKELERQQKQMEREAAKYASQIELARQQAEKAEDAEKQKQLLAQVEALQQMLTDIEGRREEILRLQTGKAGNVYIISNLGSFGDHVFKVGMTRRLDPQERVDELGSASVPFPFDVHSFIFSDDAVGLEHALHERLHSRRLNKVNLRKEFFDVSIEEIEQIVYEFQPTAEFTTTLLAEQYRQSQSIEEVPDVSELDAALLEDEEEDEGAEALA